jgi:hypothetical protein
MFELSHSGSVPIEQYYSSSAWLQWLPPDLFPDRPTPNPAASKALLRRVVLVDTKQVWVFE